MQNIKVFMPLSIRSLFEIVYQEMIDGVAELSFSLIVVTNRLRNEFQTGVYGQRIGSSRVELEVKLSS